MHDDIQFPLAFNNEADYKAHLDKIEAWRSREAEERRSDPRMSAGLREEHMIHIRDAVSAWERSKIGHLTEQARKLNIDLPPVTESDLWVGLSSSHLPYLSNKGILWLRKAIDEERIRRREAAYWWWKNVVLPSLAGLTGLVGTLTGLFAVLRHTK